MKFYLRIIASPGRVQASRKMKFVVSWERGEKVSLGLSTLYTALGSIIQNQYAAVKAPFGSIR
jgi:hypothetical protein